MFGAAMMMGGRPTYNVSISSTGGAWKRSTDASSVPSTQPIVLNLTVTAGVERQATSTSIPAIDIDGIGAGSTVNFVNSGGAFGKGGAGGLGSDTGYITVDTACDPGSQGGNGLAGGPAIKGPGAGVEFNIINSSGKIWGGGGGSGGGGSRASNAATNGAAGGGGGGGAGGGAGGAAGSHSGSVSVTATAGSAGGTGAGGTFGAGGAGNQSGTGAVGAAGGTGGDWGTAGVTGGASGAATCTRTPGAGGAAGKAIDLNGGSVTFISGSGSPNVKGAVA